MSDLDKLREIFGRIAADDMQAMRKRSVVSVARFGSVVVVTCDDGYALYMRESAWDALGKDGVDE